MSIGAVLIGLLNVALFCAIVVFIAFVIQWLVTSIFGYAFPADVLKWGKIIIALICLIAIIGWLLSLLGMGGGWSPRFFHY